jgi:hypothetical protein
LNAVITAGQRHESQFLESVMDGVKVRRPVGRSRQRPKRLAGDKAYSAIGESGVGFAASV